MRAGWLAALLLVGGAASAAADPVDALPESEPETSQSLQDPDFRVVTHQFGLERRVEMYQWRVAGEGYVRVWNDARIDSAHFAPPHQNPELPITGRRWRVEQVTMDDKPVAREVLDTLGEWRVFRPTFSRLPANLAATFQPEGDGLGSSDNPLQPGIGDLRVTWRELVLPPLAGRVRLRDGQWQLSAEAVAAPPADLKQAIDISAATRLPLLRVLPWLLGAAVVLIVVVGWLGRRRRLRKAPVE